AEGLDHGPLQVHVHGQAQVGAGDGGDPADAPQRAALDVGLDLLVADLAAQRLVVVALDARTAGVGEQRLPRSVLLDVLLVGAADVADDVRHQRAVGIATGQVGLDADPGETPLVDREARYLVGRQAQLQGHRAEAAVGLALAFEALDVLGVQRDDPGQRGDQRLRVAGV